MTSNVDFSVIMPVRNNIEGLKTCLGAFNLFTDKPERFEVHLIVDKDDNDLSTYIEMSMKCRYSIIVHIADPTDNFSDDYFNKHVKFCKGTHIWAFNDDCYIQTNKWDNIIRNEVNLNPKYKGVYLVDTFDSTRFHRGTSDGFPRFPMISRKAVDLIGFFFFPTVRNWPADKVIWELYRQQNCVIPCHKVKIQHDHNFDHEGDLTKARFMRILNEDKANGVFPVNAIRESTLLSEVKK
jgi:hypothetical protein